MFQSTYTGALIQFITELARNKKSIHFPNSNSLHSASITGSQFRPSVVRAVVWRWQMPQMLMFNGLGPQLVAWRWLEHEGTSFIDGLFHWYGQSWAGCLAVGPHSWRKESTRARLWKAYLVPSLIPSLPLFPGLQQMSIFASPCPPAATMLCLITGPKQWSKPTLD
jgi:hypothetical protein